MFGLGPSELLIILILVLFFYGGKKLPQIGDGLGRGIREFKKAVRGEDEAGSKPAPEPPPKPEQRLEGGSPPLEDSGSPVDTAGKERASSKTNNS